MGVLRVVVAALVSGFAAIAVGLLIAFVGGTTWSLLIALNLSSSPAAPWSAPLAIVLLALAWQYLSGTGWPKATQATRRAKLPQGRMTRDVWVASLSAAIGSSGLALCAMLLGFRILSIPVVPLPALATRQPGLALTYLAAAAIIAGAIEEAAFRGYMLVGVEKAWGRAPAHIIVAVAFSAVHLSSPGFIYLWPVYFLLSLALSALVTLTGSVWPGVIAHTLSDFVSYALLLFAGPVTLGATLAFAAPDGRALAVVAASAILAAATLSGFIGIRRKQDKGPRPSGD